ncbi:Conserved_hypothetical protein [Hexamita inflata]|uniref:Uncharacterized protein n=1 Tax=Hexamita inflata TaxID=28002 RepID=A0AA86U9E0_9EUKA|nr:Conserved hypothetical protein [Hexamita inflata]
MFNSRIDFCSKILELNNKQISDNIYVSKQFTNVNIFFQNTKTQNALIDIQVHNFNVNEFTLFGMSVNGHTVKESQINITLKFEVVSGALICIICDLHVYNSSLVFVATGHKISGVILEALSYIEIELTFIQFRITSKYSSGIVSLVNKSDLNLTIIDSRLAGSNLLSSEDSGYIAVAVLSTMTVSLNTFYICVNNISRFGLINATVTDHGSEMARCDVCGIQTVVYGLCADSLDHATLANGTLQCMFPFEFVDNSCVCAYGHMLNGSTCVDIIDQISSLSKYTADDTKLEQLQQNITIIENLLLQLDSNILNNVSNFSGILNSSYSNLEQFIKNNFSLADTNLLSNTTVLDQRIFDNVSSLVAAINSNFSQLETFIVSNATTLDWRIFYNISNLGSHIQNQANDIQLFNNNLQKIKQQILCSKIFGNWMVNGSCIQIICPIIGQFSINGVCQCPKNSIINNGQCECPANLTIIGYECLCETGLPIQSGICGCSTPGAFVQAGSCTCGINSLNVSNVCSCPSGSTLQAGECKCTNVNAYMSGSSCVCPTFSTLIGSTCTCPANSALIGNTCVCNQIAEQTMMAGACQCTTSGAFVNSSVCTCGVDSLNISNSCSCPINSTLVAGACTCNVISGQVMNTGTCQCSTSGAIIDAGSCSCGINGLNISNQCGCPENSTLVGNTCTCTVNAGESMQAGICKCTTSGAFVQAGSCTCGINSLNVSNVCSCPSGSTLQAGECKCSAPGAIVESGACKCSSGNLLINGACQQNYTVNDVASSLSCSQIVYVIYDVQTVTHQIIDASNFSSGYVFSAVNIVNNAFIDVSNSVYSPVVNPLFLSQSSFANIKVQIGTQTVSTGPILTSSTTNNINQVNVISKTGTQITVNTALSIIQVSSISSIINNLLINLNFAMSSGNITLINSISGVMNITSYQVQGCYQSTLAVAMIGLTTASATVNLNQITFQPSVYNVGNRSSYLLGNITSSNLQLSGIALQSGNISNYQILNGITTTTYNFYQFGGIIANSSDSNITINGLINDIYQIYNTNYVKYSGFLFGHSLNSSTIIITNLCFQQSITSSTLQFFQFGLIGYSEVNTSIQQSTIILQVQTAYLRQFGYIGYQSASSINSTIINVTTRINTIVTFSEACVGLFIGKSLSKYFVISDIKMNNCNISSKSEVGAIGTINTMNLTLYQISLINTNISADSSTIGFIGGSLTSIVNVSSFIAIQYIATASGTVGSIIGNIISSNVTISNSKVSQLYETLLYSNGGGFIGSTSVSPFITVVIENSSISNCNFTSYNQQIGGLIGGVYNLTLNIQNCTVSVLDLRGQGYLGSLLGHSMNSNVSISNSTASQTNVTATNIYVGGIVGYCYQSRLTITSSKVSNVRLTANLYIGLVLGFSPTGTGNVFSISGSSSINQNYINGTLQTNCVFPTVINANNGITC